MQTKTLNKSFVSPSRYVQGPDVLYDLPDYVKIYGKKAFILIFDLGVKMFSDRLNESFNAAGVSMDMDVFRGECSRVEIKRIKSRMEETQSDVIIAIGSGKTIDTAKAVAFSSEGISCIVCPTTCSTDAPTSGLSVVYTEDTHEFDYYMYHGKNPHMVLVDTKVIVNAPVRFLVAGEGDALATYFEARACIRKGNAVAMSGGASTLTAYALAELCYKTLLEDGLKAKIACEEKCITKSFENICEANTLLSGLGFESSGLAAAHAIHNGLTIIHEVHNSKLHGEVVAFGTICQLVLENAPMEEIDTVIKFCKSVGLPTCFADLNLENPTREQMMEVAKRACDENDTMSNMPFNVTPEDVCSAMFVANRLGQ